MADFSPFAYPGMQIVHPRIFDGVAPGKFSFVEMFHKAEAAGRLRALKHDGAWYHVGTPEAFEDTNKILSAAHPGKKCAP